jgi:hypothetical protein
MKEEDMSQRKANIVRHETIEDTGGGASPGVGSLGMLQEYVRAHMKVKGYRVVGSGNVTAPFALGGSTHIDSRQLVDEFIVWMDSFNFDVKETAAKRAVRMVIRAEIRLARATIIERLFEPLSKLEEAAARRALSSLAINVFHGDEVIVECVLAHFIWQSKRHMIGETVTDHLMPILYSRDQGSGKTTTALRLLAPLAELSGEMSFGMILDERSRVNNYATLVDEVDPTTGPVQVATLKRRVSGSTRQTRELFSHHMSTVVLHSSFIGTSNMPVADTIDDPTGHRRFIDLHHRNGDVAKGGKASVWDTINSTDFALLWRLVDAKAPSPIKAVRAQLAARQFDSDAHSSLAQFMRALDFDSPAVKALIGENDAIGASDLYELYCERTGAKLSQRRFAFEMYRLTKCGAVPFYNRIRDRRGRWYPINRGFA